MSAVVAGQLVIDGLLLGGVLALSALGFNIIFGVMRVINLAHGDFVVLSAMLCAVAFAQFGINPLLLLPLNTALGFIAGGLVYYFLLRRLPREIASAEASSLTLTYGLSFFLAGGGLALFGGAYRSVPYLTGAFQIGDLSVSQGRLLAFGAAVATAVLLGCFLRFTAAGRAIRATSQNLDGALACGVDVDRVRMLSFALGTAVATAAGTLMSFIYNLNPQMGVLFTISAFAVVVVGGLGRLCRCRRRGARARARAIVHELHRGCATRRGRSLRTLHPRFAAAAFRAARPARHVNRLGALVAAVVLALLLAAPFGVNGYVLNLLYITVLYVGLAYGWNIISGYAGYFSFGQITFFGIGAYATGLIIVNWHWHWLLAALAGGLIACGLSFPLGYVMLRLRGPFFAMGMFGLAQTVRVGISALPATGGGSGLFMPPGSDLRAIYYWSLAICAGAIALTFWIDRSAFGLRLQALREDEQIAGTLGVDALRAKMSAFALSSLIPGLLGGGYIWFLTYIEPDAAFSSRLDLQSVVMAILGGVGTLWGPLVGGVLMTQIGEALWARFPQAYLMIFGGLLVVLLLVLPRGIVPALERRFRR